MRTQKEMVESFQMTHRNFMKNMDESLDILDHDISEAHEVDTICTGAWCKAIENSLDELSNYIYSISEPRWVSNTDSRQLSRMRIRVHDMYTKYKNLGGVSTH
jgi:glutaredoxin 2